MKIQAKQLSQEEKMKTLDALYTAVSSLKGREAMKNFLRELLTESERLMLGRRILIARLLLAGGSYRDVAEELGVGLDTVARVDRWLSDQIPGYEKAIRELNEEMERRAEKRRVGRMYADTSWQGMFAQMKKKYPLHFLLFPWPAEHAPERKDKRHSMRNKRKTGRSSTSS